MPMHAKRATAILASLLALPALVRGQAVAPFPPTKPESVGLSTEKLRGLVEQMDKWVGEGLVVGAEILIVKNRKTVLHRAVGFRDRERKTPVELNTICRIRSMTKPFVGTSILMLAEAGELAIDDTVAAHLPSFDNDRSKAITIGQLLAHEAGFLQPGYPEDLASFASLRAAVDACGEAGPETRPGERYFYSDAGSATLGALVAKASGMPAEEFIQKKIIEPLGLPDTFCNLTGDDPRRSRVSSTYLRVESGFRKYWDNSMPQRMKFFRASGGMYSTPMDYARFLAAWMDRGRVGEKRLLSAASVKRALTPGAKTAKGKGTSYGQHWQIFAPGEKGQLPMFGHGGSDGTYAIAFPAMDVIACYFTQSRGGRTPNMIVPMVQAALR